MKNAGGFFLLAEYFLLTKLSSAVIIKAEILDDVFLF
jgi:hypothetical protein